MKKAEYLTRRIAAAVACLIVFAYAAVFIGLALGWISDPPTDWR